MKTTSRPPRLFLWFFRWYCDPQLLRHIEGDLMEVFHDGQHSKVHAVRGWMGTLTLRLNPEVTLHEALAKIAPVFNKYNRRPIRLPAYTSGSSPASAVRNCR